MNMAYMYFMYEYGPAKKPTISAYCDGSWISNQSTEVTYTIVTISTVTFAYLPPPLVDLLSFLKLFIIQMISS